MVDATVREAQKGDAAAVQRVARAAWHAAYDDIVGAETVDGTIDEWYDRTTLAGSIRAPEQPFHVAERNGEVIGFAHAAPGDGTTFDLVRLYVLPEQWRGGVGGRLLERTETAIRERGGEELRLDVMADNEVGVNFYGSTGFERVGEEVDERLDVRVYVYRKAL